MKETLTRKVRQLERTVRDLQSTITQTRYQLEHPVSQYDTRTRWVAIAGILKGKFKEDPVKWQKRIRSEWE